MPGGRSIKVTTDQPAYGRFSHGRGASAHRRSRGHASASASADARKLVLGMAENTILPIQPQMRCHVLLY